MLQRALSREACAKSSIVRWRNIPQELAGFYHRIVPAPGSQFEARPGMLAVGSTKGK